MPVRRHWRSTSLVKLTQCRTQTNCISLRALISAEDLGGEPAVAAGRQAPNNLGRGGRLALVFVAAHAAIGGVAGRGLDVQSEPRAGTAVEHGELAIRHLLRLVLAPLRVLSKALDQR